MYCCRKDNYYHWNNYPPNPSQMPPYRYQNPFEFYCPKIVRPYIPYGNSNNGYYEIRDYGPEPYAVNIDRITKQNDNYRSALWTGKHLQVTLMSIEVGGDIGLEIHEDVDQFIRIEEGQGIVKMGDRKESLDFQACVCDDYAFVIPAGTWHNLINTGPVPIKLYSIYAPPQHPHGTVHRTKRDAERAHD